MDMLSTLYSLMHVEDIMQFGESVPLEYRQTDEAIKRNKFRMRD